MLRPSPIPIPDEIEEDLAAARLTIEERMELLSGLVATSARLLEINVNRERVLSLRDPLPPASEAHWARLRRSARARRIM